MALIKCCECGKKISDTAPNCPKCGCPLEKQKERAVLSSRLKQELSRASVEQSGDIEQKLIATMPYDEKKKKKNSRIVLAWIVLGLAIVSILFPVVSHDEILQSEQSRWYMDALNSGTFEEQFANWFEHVFQKSAKPEITEATKEFDLYIKAQLADEVFLRQLPFFVMGIIMIIGAYLLFRAAKQYSLIIASPVNQEASVHEQDPTIGDA